MAKASWCSWRAQGLIYKPHTRIPYFQCGTQVHTLHLDPNNDLFVILLLWFIIIIIIIIIYFYVQVDYAAVFTFRLLMFVDNGLASGMGL